MDAEIISTNRCHVAGRRECLFFFRMASLVVLKRTTEMCIKVEQFLASFAPTGVVPATVCYWFTGCFDRTESDFPEIMNGLSSEAFA
jgi:hypothetical protein